MSDPIVAIYLPLIYQFGKSWWIVIWINFGCFVISLPLFWCFVRESPKFFVSVKKFEKARAVYNFISRINRRPKFTY